MNRHHTATARTLTVIALTLAATGAHAGRDLYGLGNGQDGALSVTGTTTLNINRYTTLRTTVATGATQIRVWSTTGLAVGDLLMLLRVGGMSPPSSSGSQVAVDLSTSDVGRYELARIASFSGGGRINLDAGLEHGFAEGVTQVILVREYTTVSVSANARIRPNAWDGSTGGVVAFLATGTVTIDGAIDADGRGFRGGVLNGNGPTQDGCTGLDLAAPNGQAKGEGIITSRYGSSYAGRGNFANGAGGGVCHNSGGGGGGHATFGGQGGDTWPGEAGGARAVGGLGGAALDYDLITHATFGGGGGAGHQNNTLGSSGTNGGGFIFVRANALAGTGQVRADGVDGAFNANANDGQGGAGAGGAVLIRVVGDMTCGLVSASGGDGTSFSTGNAHGPGGAGGAGRVLLQAATSSCAAVANVGATGTWTDGTTTSTWGATPSGALGVGVVTTPFPGGFNPNDQDGDGVLDVDELDADTDSDGVDDYLDPDDDGDTVPTAVDTDYLDPFVCQDLDADTCDDCAVLAQPDVDDDGFDSDADGVCDDGDTCPFAVGEIDAATDLCPGDWKHEDSGAANINDLFYSIAVDDATGRVSGTGETFTGVSPNRSDVWSMIRAVDGSVVGASTLSGGGTTGRDFGRGSVFHPDGDLVVCGGLLVNDRESRLFVSKVGLDGTVRWTWTRPGVSTNNDLCYDLAVDGAGNIYASGVIRPTKPNGNAIWVSRFDSVGRQAWEYVDDTPGSDTAFRLLVDGNAVVASGTRWISSSIGNGAWTIRLDLNGNTVWSSSYYDVGLGRGAGYNGVVADGTGTLYYIGEQAQLDGTIVPFVQRRDAATGAIAWTVAITRADIAFALSARDLFVSCNGVSIVTRIEDASHNLTLIREVDATGATVSDEIRDWFGARTFDIRAKRRDGDLYLGGRVRGPSGQDVFLMRVSWMADGC